MKERTTKSEKEFVKAISEEAKKQEVLDALSESFTDWQRVTEMVTYIAAAAAREADAATVSALCTMTAIAARAAAIFSQAEVSVGDGTRDGLDAIRPIGPLMADAYFGMRKFSAAIEMGNPPENGRRALEELKIALSRTSAVWALLGGTLVPLIEE